MTQFQIGDVVYFKSGGSAMTVAKVEGEVVEVGYNKSGEVRWARIPALALTTDKPEKETA